MKVLIACECSGMVRDAFKSRGHDAWSCDIEPTDVFGNHIQRDVLDILDDGWDLMIAHPPCTFLSCAGNRWLNPKYKDRFPTREMDRLKAAKFFMLLANAPIEKIAIENPVGVMSTIWRKPDQYVQPYFFGDYHTKRTGLWLKNLPKLIPTEIIEPLIFKGKKGKNRPIWEINSLCLDKKERSKYRSKTFEGFANAMATQWG